MFHSGFLRGTVFEGNHFSFAPLLQKTEILFKISVCSHNNDNPGTRCFSSLRELYFHFFSLYPCFSPADKPIFAFSKYPVAKQHIITRGRGAKEAVAQWAILRSRKRPERVNRNKQCEALQTSSASIEVAGSIIHIGTAFQ